MSRKDKLYLFFSIIFVIASICIIAWIDRQEVDKRINEQAALICWQKNVSQKKDDQNPPSASQSYDANIPISTKKDAVDTLNNVNMLMNSAGSDNLSTQ